MRIRGGAGLGDAIYIRPIAEHFIRAGEKVTVCSGYPDVFLGTGAKVEPFDRFNIQVLAHYVAGKQDTTTNQWQDICKSAGVSVPLRFDWTVRNPQLLEAIRADAAGRPIILVSGGRAPMGRTDGFGAELLPERSAFEATLAALDDSFLVQVGKAEPLYPLKADVNLNGSTSIPDLFDLASLCDGVVGQCSFVIPLAEAFDKPLLCVWAAHGMQANMHPYIRAITPQKVLSKPSSRFVIDDWPEEKIRAVARSFREPRLEAAA